MLTRARSPRRGFTLAEVVISAVILAVGAAALVPSLAGHYNRQRAEDTRTVLYSLAMSLTNPMTDATSSTTPATTAGYLGFARRVTKLPGRLIHLTRKPVVASAADLTCAGVQYSSIDTTLWNGTSGAGGAPGINGAWPPYSGLEIVDGKGVNTALGWVHDSIIKGTVGAGTTGYVELHIDSLSLQEAQFLDIAVDGSAGSTTGLLRYATSPNAASFQLARFLMPVPTGQAPAWC